MAAVPARRVAALPAARRPTGRPRLAAARRPRRERRRSVPFALFAMVILTAMVLGLTGTQALLAQGSFRLEELSRDADRLERDYGELVLHRAILSSPLRVERWARDAGLELRDTDDVQLLQARSPADDPPGGAGGSGGLAGRTSDGAGSPAGDPPGR